MFEVMLIRITFDHSSAEDAALYKAKTEKVRALGERIDKHFERNCTLFLLTVSFYIKLSDIHLLFVLTYSRTFL